MLECIPPSLLIPPAYLLVKLAKQCLATEGRPHKEFWLDQNLRSKNLVLTVDLSVVYCFCAVMSRHFLDLRILGNLIYSEVWAIGLQFVIFILETRLQD